MYIAVKIFQVDCMKLLRQVENSHLNLECFMYPFVAFTTHLLVWIPRHSTTLGSSIKDIFQGKEIPYLKFSTSPQCSKKYNKGSKGVKFVDFEMMKFMDSPLLHTGVQSCSTTNFLYYLCPFRKNTALFTKEFFHREQASTTGPVHIVRVSKIFIQ